MNRDLYEVFFSQLDGGHFGRLGSRTRPQRAPDCRERDAELLPVTAQWSPDGAPRPARLTPPPARQEAERGQRRGPEKGCMEVEVGIRDNQYPMHLSISHSRVLLEMTLREERVNRAPTTGVYEGWRGLEHKTAITQHIIDG